MTRKEAFPRTVRRRVGRPWTPEPVAQDFLVRTDAPSDGGLDLRAEPRTGVRRKFPGRMPVEGLLQPTKMEVVGVPQVLEKHVLRNEEPRWMPVPLRPRQGMDNLPPDPFQKRKTELKSFVKGKTAVRVRHQKMQFFEYSKMKVAFPIGSISQFGRENQIPEAFKTVPSFVRPWNPFYLLEQFPATRDGIERSFPKFVSSSWKPLSTSMDSGDCRVFLLSPNGEHPKTTNSDRRQKDIIRTFIVRALR